MVVRQGIMVLAAAGLYFLFAGQFSLSELLAGILPVSLASIFAWRWSRITRQGFFLQGPWGKILVATLWAVPRDAFKVGMVLVKILVKPPSGAVADDGIFFELAGASARYCRAYPRYAGLR